MFSGLNHSRPPHVRRNTVHSFRNFISTYKIVVKSFKSIKRHLSNNFVFPRLIYESVYWEIFYSILQIATKRKKSTSSIVELLGLHTIIKLICEDCFLHKLNEKRWQDIVLLHLAVIQEKGRLAKYSSTSFILLVIVIAKGICKLTKVEVQQQPRENTIKR